MTRREFTRGSMRSFPGALSDPCGFLNEPEPFADLKEPSAASLACSLSLASLAASTRLFTEFHRCRAGDTALCCSCSPPPLSKGPADCNVPAPSSETRDFIVASGPAEPSLSMRCFFS